MRAYLLAFDDLDTDRKTVIRAVDRIPEITNWYAFFSSTLCLASDCDAKRLAAKIRAELPDLKFIVSSIEPDQKGGRMPQSVLDFLNAPVPAEAEPA